MLLLSQRYGAASSSRIAFKLRFGELKARMPGIAETAEYAEAGCFLTYGANLAALCRRAAALGDKILRGANPAELPIEQPTHFDLHLNGKTARALGLTVPPTILVRTEKIVE